MNIHTAGNVDLELVKKNCLERHFENATNNCVLLATGSFNPIHRSHISNLKTVKDYLENHRERPLHVLAAFLSPSHDDYVHGKLGDVHLIPAGDRSQLCRAVIREEGLDSWMSVAEGEHQWDGGFVDFDDISRTLAAFINDRLYTAEGVLQHPLTVIFVCGLDHFNKCYHVALLAKEENLGCAVIYRLGADEREITRFIQGSYKAYYIPLTDERSTLVDISSTSIRQLQDKDFTDLEQLTFPSVCAYLKGKYLKN